MLQELLVGCDRSHEHQQLMGGRTARAAEYPHKRCEAIGRGLAKQLQYNWTGNVCAIKADDLNTFVENPVNPPESRHVCWNKPGEYGIPPDG